MKKSVPPRQKPAFDARILNKLRRMSNPEKQSAMTVRPMSKFGIRNYLYGLPLLLLLFMAMSSISPVPEAGLKEQGGYLKAITIIVYSFSLIFLLINYQKALSILRGRWLYIGFMVYISASVLWADDTVSTLRTSTYYWGGAVVSLLAVVAYRDNPQKFFQALFFFSIMMVGASLLLVFIYPARGIGEDGRWVGVTSHANGLGIISILSVWANVSYFYLTRSAFIKVLNISMICLSATTIVGANSATSLVVSVAILTLTLILLSFDTTRITRLIAQITGAGFFAIFCIFIVYVLAPEMFSVDAIFGIIGRNATFTGRTVLWQMGMTIIAQGPILGSGFQEYINYTGSQLKHFHSGYIELLVRGGIIALMFVIAIVFQLIFSLKRFSDPKIYIFFTTMILAILAHNVTESSFGHSVNPLWLIFSFIYFYSDRKQRAPTRNGMVQRHTYQHGVVTPSPRLLRTGLQGNGLKVSGAAEGRRSIP